MRAQEEVLEAMYMTRKNKGFTLVEILIVVIILGILAAIVIPQFTEASNDARQSSLSSDLQTVRSQIELYKVQHLDTVPDATVGEGTLFVQRMTSQTDLNGTVGAGTLGPYLQKFPTNPFNNRNTVRIGGAAAGANTHGWYFEPTLGRFSPDDNLTTADGTAHSSL
jgi:general secretion pathway protein G